MGAWSTRIRICTTSCEHYKLVNGTHVSTIKDGGYDPKTWEITKEWNNSAIVSPLLGFSWDFPAVKTEKANVDAVMKEYSPGLLTGTLDPAEHLAKYNEKLKSAGINKIVEGAQTALDAWLQENGKK
ncbi:DUF3502 domain-containing protein [Paenibacillus sp. YAF4_2]